MVTDVGVQVGLESAPPPGKLTAEVVPVAFGVVWPMATWTVYEPTMGVLTSPVTTIEAEVTLGVLAKVKVSTLLASVIIPVLGTPVVDAEIAGVPVVPGGTVIQTVVSVWAEQVNV